ncbi:Uncharacterised protein [Escherichia coli]|nr:Uncharacterised protein [Escherichia coli]CTU13833.1 Uncharacterised protein [Escherichia coli]
MLNPPDGMQLKLRIHGVNFWHFHQRFNDMSVECCHVFLQQFLCANNHINGDVFTCVELNHDSVLYFRGQLVKSDVHRIGFSLNRDKGSRLLIPAVFLHIFSIPGIEGRAGYAGFILTDNKFISAVLSCRELLQKLPMKFCACATLITSFNGSGHRNSAIFFYGLFIRNSSANKDFTHFVLPYYRFKGEQIPAIAGI